MKAAVRDRYGPPEVVRVEDVERPTPVGDQVLVRVRAASVNRADLDGLYPRWQFTRLFMGMRRPRSRGLGSDAAGIVEAVGPDVTDLKPGEAVFGELFGWGQGTFAEFVCAPQRAFAPLPKGLTFEEAAALPHSAILALQGLRRPKGRTIKSGDRVLVVGASGNVGPFAVQIAKARGAHVTGVSRTEKLEFVRALGADAVVDYTRGDWTKPAERYDWIVDVEARRSVLRSRRALRPDGVYVSLGGPTSAILDGMLLGPLLSVGSSRKMSLLLWWKPFHRPDVETLKELIASGAVKPVIDRTYPLDQVVDALRWVDDGRARGKVVISV